MSKNYKGFTLIELLVVVLIIGILASLIIVNVSEARKSARDAKRVANLKAIQSALEMYNDKNGVYPKTFSSVDPGGWSSGVTISPPGGTFFAIPGSSNGWSGKCSTFGNISDWVPGLVSGGFIPTLPTDPKPKGNDGCYIYKSNGTDYKLRANKVMETVFGNDPSDSRNSTSIQEIDDPAVAALAGTLPTIAVFSFGARGW